MYIVKYINNNNNNNNNIKFICLVSNLMHEGILRKKCTIYHNLFINKMFIFLKDDEDTTIKYYIIFISDIRKIHFWS